MKKLLFSTAFLLLAAIPAHASQDAEACLNKVIETELTEYKHPNTKAKLAASVQHDGKEYHWVDLSLGRGFLAQSEAIITTDTNGECSLLAWIRDSYATTEEYDAALGKPINEKFGEAFRRSRE